jgi:hypothetical protein
MFNQMESFVNACASYKAWLECGKDMVNFEHVFLAYDRDMEAFAKSIGTSHRWAFTYVWETVTNKGLLA